MAEALTVFRGRFQPVRTDDLRPGVEDWIGWEGEWRRLWIIEDGAYEGQWACEVADRLLRTPFAWVPEVDIATDYLKRRAGVADLAYLREMSGRIIKEPQTDDTRWAQVGLDRFAYEVLRLCKEHEAASRPEAKT